MEETTLVAVIAKPTLEAALAEIERARPYADLFEIRLDAMEEESLRRLVRFHVPVLFTFRRREGLLEEERLGWFERLLSLEPAYCDLEVDAPWIERLVGKFPRTEFIGSYHNFEETPADLDGLWRSMQHPCFSFYKIAVMARSSLDLLRLLSFGRRAEGALSCIAMGPWGRPLRVLGPVMGNRFDYAGVEETEDRYSLKTLCETYRYRKLNRDTAVYALLGDPVEQSPGHILHNRAFAERNAVYVKIRVAKEELAAALRWIRELPFEGLSITMPLKEAIVPLLDEVDALGAVNTVVRREGKLKGSNTDGVGALNAIERRLKVQGKQLSIVGAGGSARAIAFEALRRGARVALFNRTLSRAKEVAALLGCEAFPLEELASHLCDLCITTLPPTASFPLSGEVYDISCPSRGGGKEMWLEQAALQRKVWFF